MIHSNCSKSTHYKCPYCIVLYYINGIMIPHTNSLPSQLTRQKKWQHIIRTV